MCPTHIDLIAGTIAEMPVVNHHEHAWQSFSPDQAPEFDLPYLLCHSYLGGDLAAVSFDQERDLFAYLGDPGLPDGAGQAWRALRPFLDRVRNTSSFRYLLRGLKDLFQVTEEDILSDRWREASDRIREYSRQHKGQGAALCSRMGATVTVLDAKFRPGCFPPLETGGHRALQVARLDMYIHEERGLGQSLADHRPTNWDQWLATFDGMFHSCLLAGAAGFKSGLAYNRRIEYLDPPEGEAARVFRSGLLTASPQDKTLYQDFMMNRLCCLCVEAAVPLQIHTGMQTGTRHLLEDARPTLLSGLLRRHGDLRVDLLHGGYPWYIQGGLMARYFPNVYVDGSWLSHLSPSAYRQALTSWIEAVPGSKILAWGGDHTLLENSYGSLMEAKDLIAEVLADLVARGYCDVELALELGRRILHDNGVEFWSLGKANHASCAH